VWSLYLKERVEQGKKKCNALPSPPPPSPHFLRLRKTKRAWREGPGGRLGSSSRRRGEGGDAGESVSKQAQLKFSRVRGPEFVLSHGPPGPEVRAPILALLGTGASIGRPSQA
jgi:hypothetical protein